MTTVNYPDYREFFRQAMGSDSDPYPYQERLATAPALPELVDIPTGLGKTAAIVLAWLWRRRFAAQEVRRQTPRRLVYCLPMRVLVEQTRDAAVRWLSRCGLLGGEAAFDERNASLHSYKARLGDSERITVHVLMGGEDEGRWDSNPERDMILIGTQDMLLSRALNRGYGMSRYRWPLQFGLLHTDCLWVFDEVQLMGEGLATTSQLEAFRHALPRSGAEMAREGHGCRSLWMSATLQRKWLETIDFKDNVPLLQTVHLEDTDYKNREVSKRWSASKPLRRAQARMGDIPGLAREVRGAHRPGTRTIAVVNTVRRAREVFNELATVLGDADRAKRRGRKAMREKNGTSGRPGGAPTPRLVLLHSRFRPPDRERHVEAALAEVAPGEPGKIVVSTQVIEAGVDVSAAILFTELAPWASMVQRFGRCNRGGEENDQTAVYWIDIPDEAAKVAPPYTVDDLRSSADRLRGLGDVGPKSLPAVELSFQHKHVIRKKDLVELFDTTPDLAGNDIDIDRFVREVEDTDVRVFWRDWDGSAPPKDEPGPSRDELCPAPIGEFRDFVKAAQAQVFRRDFLEARWVRADSRPISPGQSFLVHWKAGGYTSETGWDAKAKHPVEPPRGRDDESSIEEAWRRYEQKLRQFVPEPDDYDDDGLSRTDRWQTIAEHTESVFAELGGITGGLNVGQSLTACLQQAARWHDWGKAHPVFQDAVVDESRPMLWKGCRVVAKAPGSRRDPQGRVVDKGFWRRYERRHFRHELASALGVLHPGALDMAEDDRVLLDFFKRAGLLTAEPDIGSWQAARDLTAYLIAAHHGRVRMSIRSLPNETKPQDGRFARGVWDGDVLPPTDLGGGVVTSKVRLSLEPMELGLCELPPFAGQPSWLERMVRLRDTLGPFRLALLEALLRAADMRASAAAGASTEQMQVEVASGRTNGDV